MSIKASAFLSFRINSPSFRAVVVLVYIPSKSLVYHCLVSLFKKHAPLVYPFQSLLS
ncbi:BgTH12-01355 [Blumeria graminis f. sp. triticale]|uniref:BgTH12-01355 n=1 Tax=Blumeria graminis f. sp. triticale TaxID=1689686 RepID=A0A9W4DJW0_BLUGR|nr:BgTH12-01355 [Blumeria graminis f. sp. triticale]